MPDIDKSSKFLAAIDKYAKNQQNEIIEKIKEIEKIELEKAEASIIEEVQKIVQKEFVAMKSKIIIEVSHKELEERKKIFQRRQELIKEIFESCNDKLISFSKSPEYIEYIKKTLYNIHKLFKNRKCEIYIKNSDFKHENLIKEIFGEDVQIIESKDIIIGGIRGYSDEIGLIADETLDSKLLDQEDFLLKNMEVFVYENE